MVSGWYMASICNIAPQYNTTMGLIHSMAQGKSNNWNRERIEAGVPWCLDNGVFADKFIESEWIGRLDGLKQYKETCAFIAVPDVVGNAKETISQFPYYRSLITDFPVALISQDGIREQEVPWDSFDCLFIGGSDEHKLGKEGGWILNEAKKHNKWIHIGRVNSASRILRFWQADSWDGTHLGFNPSSVGQFHAAVLQVRAMKAQKGMFE
jgi:hypothetical protein